MFATHKQPIFNSLLTKSKPYLIGYLILIQSLKGKASLVANRPASLPLLDCKAVWLFIVVLVAVIEMEKP